MPFVNTSIIYLQFWLYAFSASPLNSLLPGFLYLSFALCSGFSLPTSLSYSSPWRRANRAASAYIIRPQPASESQPACVRLSVPGAATEAGPYLPPSSAHLLYLSAGSLPSTHTVPIHLRREPGRTAKEKISKPKIYRKIYSCWGQAYLTSTENSHSYADRRIYTVPLIQPAGCPTQPHQQVSFKNTDSVVGHQSISSFSSTERSRV